MNNFNAIGDIYTEPFEISNDASDETQYRIILKVKRSCAANDSQYDYIKVNIAKKDFDEKDIELGDRVAIYGTITGTGSFNDEYIGNEVKANKIFAVN